MTTSVDVVSILRDAEEVLRRDHYKAIPDDLRTARAAVADLIDAVEADLRGENFDSSDEKWSDYSKRRRQERNRVANAVASVKGA